MRASHWRPAAPANHARRRARLLGLVTAMAVLVGFTCGIAPGSTAVAGAAVCAGSPSDRARATAPSGRRSEQVLDRLRTTLGSALRVSNRGASERVEVMPISTDGGFEITWAIDATRDGIVSLDIATAEARAILECVKASPLRYRRLLLKGTFPLPTPGGTAETAVVRAVYMRSTLKAIDFNDRKPVAGQTVLDLADELRLAVVLGGYGIPTEPATERRGAAPVPRRRETTRNPQSVERVQLISQGDA